MTITLSTEDEQIIRQRLDSGQFHSADEVIHHALLADRQSSIPAPPKQQTTLSEFFLQSPFAGSELDLERDKDAGRDIEF